MNPELHTLKNIIVEVIGRMPANFSGTSKPFDIPGWSSLNHMLLVATIEKHFNVRFSLSEVRSWQKIDDIIECINQHIQN